MKRLYSIILAILCGMCVALPARAEHAVNIPLYFNVRVSNDKATYTAVTSMEMAADGPGSSTVDPVDPNQATAELTGSTLVIHEYVDGNVEITVRNYELSKTILFTRFDDSLSIQLTDAAIYLITMRFEDQRTAYGVFSYPTSYGKKEVKNGQLYIRRGNSIYALPGTKVQ